MADEIEDIHQFRAEAEVLCPIKDGEHEWEHEARTSRMQHALRDARLRTLKLNPPDGAVFRGLPGRW